MFWHLRAAELDHQPSWLWVALYALETGDESVGFAYLRQACEWANADALFVLSLLLPDRPERFELDAALLDRLGVADVGGDADPTDVVRDLQVHIWRTLAAGGYEAAALELQRVGVA